MEKRIVILLLLLSSISLMSCRSVQQDTDTNTNSNVILSSITSNDDQVREIYNLYLQSGGSLSYDEWLKTIKGDKGENGEDGTSLLTGNGAPSSSAGKDNDSYIDLSTWDFYVKTNGTWVKQGNIKGADASQDTVVINAQGLDFHLLDDGTYGVSLGNADCLSSIEIPETYNNRAVTMIMPTGFLDDKQLISVSFPNSLLSIGDRAFCGCSNLEHVVYGNSLKEIGNHAFYNCALTEVILPEGLKKIGGAVFYGGVLEKVSIPNSIESIGDNPFSISNYDILNKLEDSTYFYDGYYLGNSSNPYLCLYDIFRNDKWYNRPSYFKVDNRCEVIMRNSLYVQDNMSGVIIPKSVRVISTSSLRQYSGKSLQNVFYEGTEQEWERISVSDYENDTLLTKPRYYYSESTPTESGNYWRYVDNVPTIWD